MHVAALTVTDWGPYAGRHELLLGPGVYGVVGRHDGDPGRSNWLGKTWLLSAIRFALTGRHPAPTEDDWIHHGAESGSVEAILSDGMVLRRSRERGGRTQLTLLKPGDKKPAIQKRAQELIEEQVLGMSRDELDASCWVGQKQISRLVEAGSAEATRIIGGWMGLEPLDEAEQWVRGRFRKVMTNLDTTERRLADHQAEKRPTPEKLAEVVEQLEADRARIEGERDDLLERAAVFREGEAVRASQRARADLIARLDRTCSALDDMPCPDDLDVREAEVAHQVALEALVEANGRVATIEEVTGGSYDGRCPLTCEACPVADDVVAHLSRTSSQLELAHRAQADADLVLKGARNTTDRYQRERRRVDAGEDHLRDLRDELAALGDAVEPLDVTLEEAKRQSGELADQLGLVNTALGTLVGQLEQAGRARVEVERAGEAGLALEEQIRELRADATTHREAVTILRGARREVADEALGEIRGGANNLLAAAEVDLTIEATWEREGRGLADSCRDCGAPFPKSQRVKACESCGAERGPKVIEELNITPSRSSGGADDIAGLALQLSAAAWLRRRRGSQWGTAMVDEPFGALDATNSHALSIQLRTMLGAEFGFEQAFLVAHDARIMEAMPMRLVVRSDGATSRVEVER